jgi:hypothetical protein
VGGRGRPNLDQRCICGITSDLEATLTTYLACGLYSLPAAARLLHANPDQLRRWAFGYDRGGKHYDGAITADLDELGGERALTFLDLVELMFIQGARTRASS